ncbi:uncharacterized protein FOMMEDRAFT_150204 [Fomitiporia mediterranea MF3/22]|uniref:uncharacterized protein n=1 Tax=Fomitiporia mediterranea (strain MF3/22) TaxID=694068 RepID=UPI0004409041|nr:uncharacterized protein FOMMEDRAFT_150204 [Fomitiporia mediterranea MF3/22]EJD07662.1 hypothetical protein FOMMEDRAFT_150204 [Fomitiporia mediterranea MF3/22]
MFKAFDIACGPSQLMGGWSVRNTDCLHQRRSKSDPRGACMRSSAQRTPTKVPSLTVSAKKRLKSVWRGARAEATWTTRIISIARLKCRNADHTKVLFMPWTRQKQYLNALIKVFCRRRYLSDMHQGTGMKFICTLRECFRCGMRVRKLLSLRFFQSDCHRIGDSSGRLTTRYLCYNAYEMDALSINAAPRHLHISNEVIERFELEKQSNRVALRVLRLPMRSLRFINDFDEFYVAWRNRLIQTDPVNILSHNCYSENRSTSQKRLVTIL